MAEDLGQFGPVECKLEIHRDIKAAAVLAERKVVLRAVSCISDAQVINRHSGPAEPADELTLETPLPHHPAKQMRCGGDHR